MPASVQPMASATTMTPSGIASMALRRDKPVWLVIVVTKADLFPDEVDDAVRYYSPGSGSPFAAKLDELGPVIATQRDLRRAAALVRGRRVAEGVRAIVVPGSMGVRRAAEAALRA